MLKKIRVPLLLLAIVGFGFLIIRFFPTFRMPVIFTVTLLVLHTYVWTAIRSKIKEKSVIVRYLLGFLFWLPVILLMTGAVALLIQPMDSWPPFFKIYFVGIIFTFIVTLLFPVFFIFLADVIRVLQWMTRPFIPKSKRKNKKGISRKDFLVNTGLAFGGLVFGGMSFGMLKGSYHFKTFYERLRLGNLPFDLTGFRIVQISDFHLGTWVNKEPLIRAVEHINSLKPDVVFFTGDLVNNITEEAFPFIDELRKIYAPYGIFAVLGNHDYGKYHRWDTVEAEQANFEQLLTFYEDMNWKLLRNEHVLLHIENADLAVVGVENWSSNPRFPRRGDLPKAMQLVPDGAVKVLLSHDPSHWEAEVLDFPQQIDLTLSGHTHGFQFGIETPYFRWSPAQYLYKHWAGLYAQGDKYLYVNRGIGSIGFPGRIGIRPEITCIELV